MINLLPTAELETILYARRNSRLSKWLVIVASVIMGVALIVGAGRIIIDKSADQVATQVEVGKQQLAVQKLDETQKRVEEIGSNLKLATQVLSKQVTLSKLIPQIGGALPNGTSLSGLQLNKIEGGIDLVVVASSYQTATQVQVNLEDPTNKLFEKADINSITCTGSDDPRYPCTANLRALFTEDNPFSFLNQGATP